MKDLSAASSLHLVAYWFLARGPKALLMRLVLQGFRLITGRPIFRFSQITPQLYVGGQPRRQGWASMRERGITCVVNLRRSDDLKRGLEPGNYLHLPTPDNYPPSLEALHEGVTFIDSCIKHGDVIYVHCGVGVGRAPTLVAAYLVYTGMRPDAAWELLRRKRPIIMPLPGQVQQVVSYYQLLQQVQAK